MGAADTTVYAHWTIRSYTVAFDANGGSAVASQTVKYGAKATQPANPTRTGYTFQLVHGQGRRREVRLQPDRDR